MDLVGVTVCFVIADSGCEAHLSISPDRVEQLYDDIEKMLGRLGAFLAHMQKLVGEFYFPRTTVMGKMGRVALRPLYDAEVGGGR